MRFSMFASTVLLAIAFATASTAPLYAQADEAPVCNNGGPYTFECTGPQTQVQLDGSASFDPDGTRR